MVSNDCDILMLHCVTLGFQQTNLLAKSDPLSLKEKSKVFKYAKMTIEMIDKWVTSLRFNEIKNN